VGVPHAFSGRKEIEAHRRHHSEVYRNTPLYCAVSKENSSVCNALHVSDYEGDGIVYKPDQYWNKSATIPEHASVLLQSGKLDPVTPFKYAEYLLDALDGDNKELIAFDFSVHDTISSTPLTEGGHRSETCGLNLLASYVENHGDLGLLDRACVQEMPAFNLTAPTDVLYEFLGTDDAYDGVYNASLRASLAE
jgi:hypothetical protein